MDLACDHIQEDVYQGGEADGEQSSLNHDLQEAYRAFSASPWGARIGGFLGSVVKQGGSVYSEAQQEFSALGQDATKGITDLRDTIINRTRSLSIHVPGVSKDGEADDAEADDKDSQTTPTTSKRVGTGEHESSVLEKLRREAAKRLKDIQRAEDAADEALLNFGISVRDFLREAISIAPPSEASEQAPGTILFESKDAQGKRVIHASRYDAQLHVVHTSMESFKRDPAGDEYTTWAKDFDVDRKTDDIASDLAAYPELRDTMEKVVPDQVSYADFWTRYYFLRHGIETAEARRRDLLKAASAEDDVRWDDDSEEEGEEEEDDDDDDVKTDDQKPSKPVSAKTTNRPMSASSSTTIQPPQASSLAQPADARKSNDEKSVADSDTSYDMVGTASGVASQAPNSPKDSKKAGQDSDDSSDEDWE